MRTLRERHPDVEIDVIGGSSLAREGANVLVSTEDFSVLGLAEGVGVLSAHLSALRFISKRFATTGYDLVILVDYPGFHLRVAAAASRCDLPVLYYIAPQVWAWGRWRVHSIRKHVRLVASVLPFEAEFFRRQGLEVEFVGHPLLDREGVPSRESARASLGLGPQSRVLGLLPGSRKSEVSRIWPCFRDAAKRVTDADPSLRVLVAGVEGNEYPGVADFELCMMDATRVIAASDALLCKSGTATLEAAIADTPAVIAYLMHPATYRVAKLAVRLSNVGLVNLVAERTVCPEFLQGGATPRNIADSVIPLLDAGGESAARQRVGFAEVRSKLGGPGATRRVAELAERLVSG